MGVTPSPLVVVRVLVEGGHDVAADLERLEQVGAVVEPFPLGEGRWVGRGRVPREALEKIKRILPHALVRSFADEDTEARVLLLELLAAAGEAVVPEEAVVGAATTLGLHPARAALALDDLGTADWIGLAGRGGDVVVTVTAKGALQIKVAKAGRARWPGTRGTLPPLGTEGEIVVKELLPDPSVNESTGTGGPHMHTSTADRVGPERSGPRELENPTDDHRIEITELDAPPPQPDEPTEQAATQSAAVASVEPAPAGAEPTGPRQIDREHAVTTDMAAPKDGIFVLKKARRLVVDGTPVNFSNAEGRWGDMVVLINARRHRPDTGWTEKLRERWRYDKLAEFFTSRGVPVNSVIERGETPPKMRLARPPIYPGDEPGPHHPPPPI